MRRSFFITLILLLITILLMQGKEICQITEEKQRLKGQIASDLPKEAAVTKVAINIGQLFEKVYLNDKNVKVDNIVFNQSKTEAEIEMSIQGDIGYVKNIVEGMKGSPGFCGVKKYVEKNGEPKKIHLVFNGEK